MHNLKNSAGGLFLALGLGGCGVAATPVINDRVQAQASVEHSLDRLHALQIVSGESLVLELPAEATACYSLPCPGSRWVPIYDAEIVRQATRLAELTDIAEAVIADTTVARSAMSESTAAVTALSALKLITVERLVEDQPNNNPECYNLPCESDKLAAQQANELRVGQALAIVGRAQGL